MTTIIHIVFARRRGDVQQVGLKQLPVNGDGCCRVNRAVEKWCRTAGATRLFASASGNVAAEFYRGFVDRMVEKQLCTT